MHLTDILRQRQGHAFASFELVPPLKGSDASKLESVLRHLLEVEPPFINITCHRDETEYHANPDGTFSKLTLAKRPSTLAVVAAAQQCCRGTAIVPHVICGGASRQHIENELLDFRFLGIDNVMALRGDAPLGQKHFIPEPSGFAHTNELVALISNLNSGKYLDPTVKDPQPTSFCVGVAAYPEKHFEAPNIEEDIANLKRKVEAGADYVVTQMFFSNDVFYDFVRRARAAGIAVPIIPGLKPLATVRQIELLPRTFHIDIPADLATAMRNAPTADAARNVGTEWALMQSRDLLRHGVPAIHYYTMGNPDNALKIVRQAF